MLTGRPPFREATPLDTLVQVLEAEPRLPSQINPKVPRDLEMICLRCIEKFAQNRYASAAALADDLERYLKSESVDARPPGLVQRVRRWSRREPALSSRLGVLALCVVILQINYWMTQGTDDAVDPRAHAQVMIVLALWAAGSLVCQRGLSHEESAEPVRYVWAATDAVMLTLILWLTDNVQSPVVVGFPALVATSGLWFRERLVWFMTGICSICYVALLVDWTRRGHELHEPLFRHIILLVVLIGLGFVVAYQVKRIRALSRYYEHRRLP
jgi:serine/threonine-protein kinase